VSKYILAFRGQPDRAHQPDEGQQWGAWFAGLGAAIVDLGNQVGTVRTLHGEGGGDPASAALTGYVVITAAGPRRGCPPGRRLPWPAARGQRRGRRDCRRL